MAESGSWPGSLMCRCRAAPPGLLGVQSGCERSSTVLHEALQLALRRATGRGQRGSGRPARPARAPRPGARRRMAWSQTNRPRSPSMRAASPAGSRSSVNETVEVRGDPGAGRRASRRGCRRARHAATVPTAVERARPACRPRPPAAGPSARREDPLPPRSCVSRSRSAMKSTAAIVPAIPSAVQRPRLPDVRGLGSLAWTAAAARPAPSPR